MSLLGSLLLGPLLAAAFSAPSAGSNLVSSVPLQPQQPAAPPPAVPLAERREMRAELMRLLPAEGEAPAFARDELEQAIEQLEQLEQRPETADFNRLGVTGAWTLRALTEPAHDSAITAFEMRTADLTVHGIEQRVEGGGTTVVAVDFELAEDVGELRGRLEVDGTLALTPMADSLDLRSAARRLRLPRVPKSVPVEDLMRVLHARLSPEFRAEDGVRIGLQTTYMDDQMRITRCTTGKLRGECMVHVRAGAPPVPVEGR